MEARVRSIQRVLDHLYPNPPIPLDHSDNFTLLIAVILSAQTTDGKVNEVTKELFRLAPTPQRLAKLSYDKVLSIIRPVGLAPGKSKNIIGAAKMICERFNGEVPNTFEDLESLPGVGHKTASVVMTQAFGHPAFPIDTHVHRLALRWGLSKSQDVKKVESDLKALFPPESWAKVGLQAIYFGREHCAAKAHQPSHCPICSWVNGAKRGPAEGEDLGAFLSRFQSPGKANKHIILYSERSAVAGTAMLGPTSLKMEAEVDIKVQVKAEVKAEQPPQQDGKGKRKGRGNGGSSNGSSDSGKRVTRTTRAAAAVVSIKSSTTTAAAAKTEKTTSAVTTRRKSPADASTAPSALPPGGKGRKRGAAPAAPGGKRARRN